MCKRTEGQHRGKSNWEDTEIRRDLFQLLADRQPIEGGQNLSVRVYNERFNWHVSRTDGSAKPFRSLPLLVLPPHEEAYIPTRKDANG